MAGGGGCRMSRKSFCRSRKYSQRTVARRRRQSRIMTALMQTSTVPRTHLTPASSSVPAQPSVIELGIPER